MKKNFLISALLLLVVNLYAQFPPAAETQEQILIETNNTSLVFSVGKNHKLYQIYLGEKLLNPEDYKTLPNQHEAYVPSGMDNLFEPAIKCFTTMEILRSNYWWLKIK